MKYKDIALIESRIQPVTTLLAQHSIKIAPLAIVTHTLWVNNQRTDDYTPDGTESFPYKGVQAAHDVIDPTNYLTDNQFSTETDLTGFAAKLSATLSRDTAEYKLGAASLKIVTPGAVTEEGVILSDATVLPSASYTVDVWVKGSGTVKLALQEKTSAGAVVGTTVRATITLTSTWTRYDLARTFGATGVSAAILLYTATTQATTFYADGFKFRPTSEYPSASNIYEIRVKLGLPYTGNLTLTKDFLTIAGDGGVTGAGYRGTINSTSPHLTLRNISIVSTSVINQIMPGHFLLELKDIHSNTATWNIEATGTSTEKGDSYVQVYGHNTIWTGGAINVTGIQGGVYLTGGAYYGIPEINITDSLFDPGCSCVDNNVLNLEVDSVSELMNMKAARNTVHAKSGSTVYADITALSNLDNTFDLQAGSTLIRVSDKQILEAISLIRTTTVYLDANRTDTYTEDGSIVYPYKSIGAFITDHASDTLPLAIHMTPATYSKTGDISFPDVPITIYGNNSTLAVSGTTTVNNIHHIYDLHTTGAVVYAYTGATRSTRTGGSINGAVTIAGGFPHFENLNYTGAMGITAGNPYFRGLTGGGRITLNGADAVLSVADCNMDMDLALQNITVTAGQLIVNGGLFTNSGAVPNIVFNNTNYTDLTKAHMLSGVVANYGITSTAALTIVSPTCIIPVMSGLITPTPVIPAYGIGGGTAQAQTATVPIFAASYFAGLRFSVFLTATNTDADPTMNLNGLGAKTVKSSAGGAIVVGDMVANSIADFIYDGTYLRLLNPQ